MPDKNKISSPEQLNSYIHVTSPGAWIVLASVMVFFLGFFTWIFFGNLEISDASSSEIHTIKPLSFLLK